MQAPAYFDDVMPLYRRREDEQYLRIGDWTAFIPPEVIRVKTISNADTHIALRTTSTVKTKSGYSEVEISIPLFFYGPEEINGVEVESFDGKFYYDGLRALLAQFTRTPILPIKNKYLNEVHGIHNVILSNISISTVDGFPNCLQGELTLYKTSVSPYLCTLDETEYHDRIFWPLFRWYYQKMLRKGESSTYLQPIDASGMNGRFKLEILDEKCLAYEGPDSVDKDYNYKSIPLDEEKLVVKSISFARVNIFTNLQTQLASTPTHQYIGPMDTVFNIVLETESEENVQKILEAYKTAETYSRQYRDRFIGGFVRVKNEIVQLTGCDKLMFAAIQVDTDPGYPGSYVIKMSMHAFDSTQKKLEQLRRISPVDNSKEAKDLWDEVEEIYSTPFAKNFTDIIHECIADELLATLNLYPDLELPTYVEVARIVEKINEFRSKHGLKEFEYEPAVYHPYRPQDRVDPDFYVVYDKNVYGGIPDLTDASDDVTSLFLTKNIYGLKVDTTEDEIYLELPDGIKIQPSGNNKLVKASDPDTIKNSAINSYSHFPLNTTCGLSAEEINRFLSSGGRGGGVIEGQGEAFIRAERESGVNALFLVALAGHESNWGRSSYARQRYNIFSIGITDSGDYRYRYKSVEDAIIKGAKWIASEYIAVGQNTLWKMQHGGNHCYNTRDSWREGVASIMAELLPIKEALKRAKFTSIELVDKNPQAQQKSSTIAFRRVEISVEDGKNLPDKLKEFREKELTTKYGERPAFSQGDELVQEMFHDMVKYSCRGRMVRAYPAFCLLFIDEGPWVDGRRLWTNYYSYHSLVNISVVKERNNPVDVAYIELLNIYGTLNIGSKVRQVGKFSFLDVINPKINEYMIEERRKIIEQLNIKPGTRVHLRMGYGANARYMPVLFNGIIAEIEPGDLYRLVCQGDGHELMNILDDITEEEDVNNFYEFGTEPYNIIENIIGDRSFLFNITRRWGEDSPYGVNHFGTIKKKGWLVYLEDDYEPMKNVYYANSDKEPAMKWWQRWTPFDGEENIQLYLFNRPIWDILMTLAKSYYDYVPYVHPHMFRSTLFFGQPWWPVKYYIKRKKKEPGFLDLLPSALGHMFNFAIDFFMYFNPTLAFQGAQNLLKDFEKALTDLQIKYEQEKNLETEYEFVELWKPLMQAHVLNSFHDIIDNSLVATGRNLYTNVVALYQEGNDKGDVKAAPTVHADRNILSEYQKTKIIDTGTIQDYIGPDGIYSFFGLNTGRQRAIRIATRELQDIFRDMYQGDITILGDTTIKPIDIIILDDIKEQMEGPIQVGLVVHQFSHETGFVTMIKPDLFVVPTDSPLNEIIGIIEGFGGLVKMLSTVWILAKLEARGFKLVANTLEILKSFGSTATTFLKTGNLLKALKNLGSAVNALKALGSATGAGLVIGIATTLLLNPIITMIEEYLITSNVIKVYPVWLKGQPLLAGVNGHKVLVPGIQDANVYGVLDKSKPVSNTVDYKAAGGAIDPSEQLKSKATTTATTTKTTALKDGVSEFDWPLKGPISISSYFDPTGKKIGRRHLGIDLAAPMNTPVYAAAAGTVTVCSYEAGGYGKYVTIDHGKRWATIYAHLNKWVVKPYQKVKKGDLIGYVGSTGRSTGPHLHFEIIEGDKRRNPLDLLPPLT